MELPKRKRTRLKNYDYSTQGAYFVTICTKERKQYLSKITVGEGLSALPKNNLTSIGEEVEKSIKYINENYNKASIEKYVIMPNHIHLIVILQQTGRDGTLPLQSIIGQLKSYTTRKFGDTLWQRSYHDHVIRGKFDFDKIWQYIDSNVIQWEKDCFYVE